MRPTMLAVGLAGTLLMAGCARPTAAEVAGERLDEAGVVAGTTWQLVDGQLDGEPLALLDDRPITLTRRDDGRVEGQSSCNLYAESSGDDATMSELLFPEVANSERGCPGDAVMQLEEAYLTALRETTTATAEDTTLTLQGPRSTLVYALDGSAVDATAPPDPTWVDPATDPTPTDPTSVDPADPTATDPGPTDAGGLLDVDGTWVLAAGTVDGVAIEVVDGARVDLTPVDGQVVGRSGCNEYGADVTVDGDRIAITALGGTEMACVEPLMGLESTYLAALPRATAIDRTEGRLTLSGDGVKLTFTEESPLTTGALVGTRWELEVLVTGTTTTPAEGDGFLLLDPDGTMTGSTGCRALTGEWVGVGSGLVIPTMAADGTCEPGLADQDARVVGVLEDIDVAIDGDRLTLTSRHPGSAGDALVLRATPMAPPASPSTSGPSDDTGPNMVGSVFVWRVGEGHDHALRVHGDGRGRHRLGPAMKP